MATSDVNTLFRRFGGNASGYQEIISRDQVTQAETKWPMLGQIKPTTPHEAPSARRAAPPSVRQIQDEEPLPRQSPPLQPEYPASAVQHPPQKGQGLQQVFQTLSPPPPVPTGPAEKVFQQEKTSRPSSSPAAGMFAGLQPSAFANQKSQKQPSTGLFPNQTVQAVQAAAPKNGAGSSESSTDGLVGRKFGSGVGMGGAAPVEGLARGESRANGVFSKSDGNVDKNSQLQQVFGRMLSQPEPPQQTKGEGISKRPLKW